MKFRFIIDAECERTEGKFAGREEIEGLFISDLENAQPDLSGLENGGSYDVSRFDVSADDPDNVSVHRYRLQALVGVAMEALALYNVSVHYPKDATPAKSFKHLGRLLAKVSGLPVKLAERAYVERSGTSRRSGRERRDRISDHTMRRPSEVVAHQEERSGERRNGIERRK